MQNLHDLLDHQKLEANQHEIVQEHSINNQSIYISGSIYDYPHLELTEKS